MKPRLRRGKVFLKVSLVLLVAKNFLPFGEPIESRCGEIFKWCCCEGMIEGIVEGGNPPVVTRPPGNPEFMLAVTCANNAGLTTPGAVVDKE